MKHTENDLDPIDAQEQEMGHDQTTRFVKKLCRISAGPFSATIYETDLDPKTNTAGHRVTVCHLDQTIRKATGQEYLEHFYNLDTHAMNASIELGDYHGINVGWKEAYQYANVSDQAARVIDALSRGQTVHDWFHETRPDPQYVQVETPVPSLKPPRPKNRLPSTGPTIWS
jgi:hypothetical protein